LGPEYLLTRCCWPSKSEFRGFTLNIQSLQYCRSGLDKLALFHASASSEVDEWVYVVPEEARNILGKHEIQRQSNIYELVKSERNFITGMQIFLYVSTISLDIYIFITMS
jgi:hypothetical protein